MLAEMAKFHNSSESIQIKRLFPGFLIRMHVDVLLSLYRHFLFFFSPHPRNSVRLKCFMNLLSWIRFTSQCHDAQKHRSCFLPAFVPWTILAENSLVFEQARHNEDNSSMINNDSKISLSFLFFGFAFYRFFYLPEWNTRAPLSFGHLLQNKRQNISLLFQPTVKKRALIQTP